MLKKIAAFFCLAGCFQVAFAAEFPSLYYQPISAFEELDEEEFFYRQSCDERDFDYRASESDQLEAYNHILQMQQDGFFDADHHLVSRSLNNPYISDDIWQHVTPYLIPDDHPAKEALDKIFSSSRALRSVKAMRQAGFSNPVPGYKGMIVTKHKSIPGYLIKAYLDTTNIPEWLALTHRAIGARYIQNTIDKFGYQGIMKVPKKWIYPLPAEPSPPQEEGYFRKNFVLVVENMKILSFADNEAAYKRLITKKILEALYTVLREDKLVDSVYIDNIPFSRDGKIAFVDTEHFNTTTKPLHLEHLARCFSKSMRAYWLQLCSNGIQNEGK